MNLCKEGFFIFIPNFFKGKKKKSKLHFKISFILPLIFIIIGIFLGYKIFTKPKTPPKQWTLTENENKNVKFLTEESLVKEIRDVNKIIPLEIELSETIVVDKSWGDFEVFKKIKRIKFFANCSYAVDLSAIENKDITINKFKNEITLSLPKPKVFSVDIDEDKTIYEESSNGLLRFGDIKLTSEEFGVIQMEVAKTFESKMNDPEIYNKAVSNTTIVLEKVLNQIANNEMKVTINFKD
ncbi:DUF4230 domain-containing protein [Clostridium chauvoei]|uniref:DUF4230 domain-containing protein n=2 Tax=Clostridium chauvoei TaxID=46867 RepID=S6FQK2_9CLOT|nr:DUF4230 domain-containing protein [Clostridium chauvoei]MBX7281790.1 DUF4230 domain-containing protein [Clostridium chauvoei]MBX7284317.1 DUF4230 domain-containing protein [Clostridium chauvoei]MBX7286819.1 DUF4230 domain-containing protein [Clostridium chauvoei]MBX7289366.1 DUF4230 domain-containing protein [Clostridium chauvoei]MBX7291880.1 DUF4230 domain-containing protein [Clostridium chauvoei]